MHWLLLRLSVEEAMWLPQMVEKRIGEGNSEAVRKGGGFEQAVRVSTDLANRTIRLRSGSRERLVALLEWVLRTSSTADCLLVQSAMPPAFGSTQTEG
ncbi:hypothetical protein ACFPC0_10870 [Streptomyces andamanensis]|uniref:Uncharacterized protein n=1 Tax=Streptomyces andamanensis TaxID=1565035 RepID=A0ABV8TCL7_9ACTN